MKRTIWKYKLEPETTLHLPLGAQVLTVQTQREEPQLWALVDPSLPTEARRFRTFGTGTPVPDDPLTYIATFQLNRGALVFHVFEEA